MEKKKAITISELDVEPISNEELAALSGGAKEAGISFCGCIVYRSDIVIICGVE